jgi:hypothetical protein
MENEMLRHTVATLAYRGSKALRYAPAGFSEYRAAEGSRSAGEILAHIGDLMEWALSMAEGKEAWRDTLDREWEAEVERFHETVGQLDARLAEGPPACSGERLFQGPIADALTHVGQLAMLRRLAGSPVRGENFFRAGIEIGRIGPEQAKPVREFD